MKFIITSIIAFLGTSVIGQVDKQIIIEHFTNTVCSVCASKNPDLNANLQNNPEVIRISYHPSSPYSSCVFNQHNVSGNDDRTNQYGIYGATPRIVIQGSVISPNQDFAANDLFDSYKNEYSPVLLNTSIDSITLDSVYVTVTVKTVASISLPDNLLYVALVEEMISYNAPNGEGTHYNVYRKALNGNQGTQISLAPTIGDSVVLHFSSKNHVDWNLSELVAVSVIQNLTDLSVLQSSISTVAQVDNSSLNELEGDEGFDVHFNASSNQLSIFKENCNSCSNYEIVALQGGVVNQGYLTGNLTYVELTNLSKGIYLIRLTSPDKQRYSKAVKFVK